ncbi:MAG: redoxin domain-containing protein [Planctomycetes bacterium]|nr:redoxin domain-containing protein [Planctomycetota bacterium]
MFVRLAIACAALFAFVAPSQAQAPQKTQAQVALKTGMPAPALSIEKWVKGSPVASFEKGKVYVLEFWATWCGPCIAQMPHVSRLQREYAAQNVTIIGVTSEDPENSLASVEAMVADKGDGMGYTVAWDSGRKTNEAYMKASAQRGIPCSFLVDQQGNVAYIGHPMFLDVPLKQVVAGTWDIEKGNAMIADVQSKMSAVYKALRSDPKAGLEKLAAIEREYPDFAGHNDGLRFDLLLAAGELDGAYALGKTLVDLAITEKNSAELNDIAWKIVDPEAKHTRRDVELALRAAERAADFTHWKDGAILDTLARAYFWKGDTAKAIEIQTKAVATAKGEMKKQLEQVLAEYQGKNTQ